MPWWLVGLSIYATAIDSSDLVADSGGTYALGLGVCVMNWVGVPGGWARGNSPRRGPLHAGWEIRIGEPG